MIKLQLFDHKNSQYERPNLDFRCASDRHCIVGPDASGRCHGTSVCIPQKSKEQWKCMQGDGNSPCEKGPNLDGTCCQTLPPCKPILQHRKIRKRISIILLMTLAGVLLVITGKQQTTPFITPGPLTAYHQSQSQDCGTCHDINAGSPVDWWHNFMKTKSSSVKNKKCMQCHNMGPNAGQSHNLTTQELQILTAKMPLPQYTLAEMLRPKLSTTEILACADCHKEHLGNTQVKILTNEQCQTCHISHIDSFSSNHPDFSNYPSIRRTRINFDHSKHFNKHFTGKKAALAPNNCVACHQLEERENYMITKNFERACGSCHMDQIDKRNMAFFTLPKLDTKSLANLDQSVGEWYKRAKGKLTPFTELLLSSDVEAQQLLADLSAVKLIKLKKEELETKQKVTQLIWKLKALLVELTGSKGNQNLVARIEIMHGTELSKEDKRLLNSIPLDLLKNELQLWLPNLETELAAKIKGQRHAEIAEGAAAGNTALKDQWTRSGSWYTKNTSLYYTPASHGDKFVRLLFRLTENSNSVAGQKIFDSLSHQKKGIGACAKCHSIDEDEKQSSKQVNWLGFRNDPNHKSFTRFNHALHLSMATEKGCDNCHKLNKKANYSEAFKKGQMSAKIFQSNFKTLNRSECSGCHQKERVGEDCVSCHNFHVGQFDNLLPATELQLK